MSIKKRITQTMNIIDDFIKLDMDAPQIAERTEKDLAFNRKVKSCYDMYQWLYKNDILRKEAFLYTENSSVEELEVSFAIDTENLLPYRKKMETSELKMQILPATISLGIRGTKHLQVNIPVRFFYPGAC